MKQKTTTADTKNEALLKNYKLRLNDSGHALSPATLHLLQQKIIELKKQTKQK
tara:strand:+ start:1319 stop:1477 length:159 start_codon:yes stop_codon:yes gene_type:complete